MAAQSTQLSSRIYPSRPLDPNAREIRILRLQPDKYGTEISCTVEIALLDQYFWNQSSVDDWLQQHDDWARSISPFSRSELSESLTSLKHDIEHPWTCRSRRRFGRGMRRSRFHFGRNLTSHEVPSCRSSPCQCYEAVSYVWGPSNENRSITLSVQAGFAVTDNLYSALQRLRYPEGQRVLWIDAICIKQDDLEERAQQVRTMADIFRKTWNMIVWLGDTSVALPETEAKGLAPKNEDRSSDQTRAIFLAALSELTPKGCSRWWQRMWTFPELVAFGCEPGPEVALGSIRTGWEQFLRIFSDRDFAQTLRSIRWHGRQPSILEALTLARSRKCSDPRDYVYSLLGVIDGREAELLTPNYSPDFTSSMAFTDATAAAIKAHRDLRALAFVDPTLPRPLDLPSWAINFGERKLLNGDFGHDMRGPRNFEKVPLESWIKGRPPPKCKIASSKERLCAHGILFDRIACVKPDRDMIGNDGAVAPALSDSDRRISVHYPYCIASRLNRRDPKQDQHGCIQGCPGELLCPQEILVDGVGTAPDFVTEAGFMGLGFDGIREGDIVALLDFSKRPAILRRGENVEYYTFHGLAQVSWDVLIYHITDLGLPEIDFEIR